MLASMNKVVIITLALFFNSFSYAKKVESFGHSTCRNAPLYESLDSGGYNAGFLTFDGNINTQLTRTQLVNIKFFSSLREYFDKLCIDKVPYSTEHLRMWLQENANISMRRWRTVYFPVGDYSVGDKNCLSCCSDYPSKNDFDGVIIVGSADLSGVERDNLILSYRRGHEVALHLPQNKPIYLIALGDALQTGQVRGPAPYYRRADIYFFKH